MNYLSALLSEDGTSAGLSSVRVGMFVVVLPIMAVWTYVSLKTGVLQPLSTEHIGFALGAMTVKAWQRGRENSEPQTAS